MKKRLLHGLIYIILGLIVSIGVLTVFHACPVMKDMIMKCYWTQRVSVAVGIGIVILGVLAVFVKGKGFADGLDVAAVLFGVLLILLPTVLIGVCGAKHMHCHAATRPALMIAGALTILYGGCSILWRRRNKEA